MTDYATEFAEAERLALKAASLGKDDAVALATAGFTLASCGVHVEYGDDLISQALVLNPNLAWAWLFSGWTKASLGEPEVAIDYVCRAMRLSPNDPHRFSMYGALAMAHYLAGRYAEAITFAEAANREQRGFVLPQCVLAASEAFLGQLGAAQATVRRLLESQPTLRISNLQSLMVLRRPQDITNWERGMRLAGLPE